MVRIAHPLPCELSVLHTEQVYSAYVYLLEVIIEDVAVVQVWFDELIDVFCRARHRKPFDKDVHA
jgi:hypothetical protein